VKEEEEEKVEDEEEEEEEKVDTQSKLYPVFSSTRIKLTFFIFENID